MEVNKHISIRLTPELILKNCSEAELKRIYHLLRTRYRSVLQEKQTEESKEYPLER